MLNWNPLWPGTGSSDYRDTAHATAARNGAALWNPASLLEMQAYFWSQVIDANRNFWSMCAATFPGVPAAATAAVIKPEATDGVVEPAAATHAVEDLESVLESQTRFWNHMLDANRNVWSGMAWNMADTPFAEPAVAQTAPPRRTTSVATKPSRPVARKPAPAKTKAQRKH